MAIIPRGNGLVVKPMIIGHGDIASVLKDREDRIYFASGVSNSQEKRESEYLRELVLLMEQDSHRHLVYFSSLCIFYSDSRYSIHKQLMEQAVMDRFRTYTIVRLGNITWGKNPHTLINYLRAHPEAEIKDIYRFIVSKEEFLYWMEMIPNFSCEMNIPGCRMLVKEIKEKYVI
jgi:hypothetical protein